MTDPLGLISSSIPAAGRIALRPQGSSGEEHGGPTFKDSLLAEIGKVNELQKDADRAIEDFATGERDDIEGVMLATLQADAAFRMLLQVRNKVMEAYEEVKQIRI